jgi:hypothetical protein
MSQLMQRSLRLGAFASGLLVGAASVVFAYSNHGAVTLSWWRLHYGGVPLWTVALVPLLVGVAVGYLYHLPARMYHVHEHMRHRHLVHAQEKELKHLRHSLDQMVGPPMEDDVPAHGTAEVVELTKSLPGGARRGRRRDQQDLAAAE